MAKNFEKTVYEGLAADVVNNPNANFKMSNYPEFISRGHSREEFDGWIDYCRLANDLLDHSAKVNDIKAYALSAIKFARESSDSNRQEMCQNAESIGILGISHLVYLAAQNKIPRYRLLSDELDLVRQAEELGRGSRGEILTYADNYGNKDVRSYDYLNVPAHEGGRKDIYVIFSGHQESGTKGVESVFHYIRNNRCLPDGIMLLGLQDNQNLTDFSSQFKLRKSSEYRMYMRQAIAAGLPKGLLKKLLMTPHDTSTEENIDLAVETLCKYGVDKANLIFIGYPVYQLRTATEMAWGLAHNDQAPDCWIRIADIAPKTADEERILSYDILDMQLADLSFANCVAHLYREHGKKRYPIPGLDKYPEKFKPLLPLFLGYSYANVANEMCGTDERVANVLKICRTLMLADHDRGMSGEVQDRQQMEYSWLLNHKLVEQRFTSQELLTKGRLMSEEEFLSAVLKVQDGM